VGDYEECENGRKIQFKVQDDGGTYNVYSRILDGNSNLVQDWTETNLTGVDNAPIACRESVSTNGGPAWRIGVLHSVGGSLLTRYSQDCVNFT
jgi:hypothetical protein